LNETTITAIKDFKKNQLQGLWIGLINSWRNRKSPFHLRIENLLMRGSKSTRQYPNIPENFNYYEIITAPEVFAIHKK